MKIGDVVLIEQDNKKRMHWPIGTIMELYPSQKDNQVRVVKVKVEGKQFTRPVKRIYPFEVEENDKGN